MRNQAQAWIVVLVLGAATVSACGGAGECSPTCGPNFECFYSVCVPRPADSGTTDGDTVVPHEDGSSEDVSEVRPDGFRCTTAEECDDGNSCTADSCDPGSGACLNQAVPDDVPCDDDGDPCTLDICFGGVCTHPVGTGCCSVPGDCEDGNPCTTDDCVDGWCANVALPDCCARDADCMWADHLWECDTGAGTCYEPPENGFCESCSTRADCGDGGTESDDYCTTYMSGDRGCSKDCLDDLDCPGASYCWSPATRELCGAGEAGCMCVSRFNSCAGYERFGTWCIVGLGGDEYCRSCTGCGDFVCRSGGCTAACGVPHDCPTGWDCVEGFCASPG